MPPDPARRAALADAATDYVLEHGLIELSLRPLAAALGTSDRMLLYHFDNKDDLVATVLRVSNDRTVALIRGLSPGPDVRRAVLDLWELYQTPQLSRCQRTYVEAAALGLFGREPYAGVVREANEVYVAAVSDYLTACGMPADRAGRAAAFMDAAMMGFALDAPLDEGDPVRDQAVQDLAAAVASIAAVQSQGSA